MKQTTIIKNEKKRGLRFSRKPRLYTMRREGETSNSNQKNLPDINKRPPRKMVPEVGIEPTRGCPRGILNPVRLPISPLRRFKFSIKLEQKYSTPSAKLAKISVTSSKIRWSGFPTSYYEICNRYLDKITGGKIEPEVHEFYQPLVGLGPESRSE